jgi:GNAT superfamily N-acetyltransferase
MDGLLIRAIAEDDMALLSAAFDEGTPEQPEQGLSRQRDGTGDFVVAFLYGEPVGYLALYWDSEPHAPPAWQGNVANLSGFVVREQYRSHGIGTEMMYAAERLTRNAGFTRISLGVGVENHRARRCTSDWPIGMPDLSLWRTVAPSEAGMARCMSGGRRGPSWSRTCRLAGSTVSRVE